MSTEEEVVEPPVCDEEWWNEDRFSPFWRQYQDCMQGSAAGFPGASYDDLQENRWTTRLGQLENRLEEDRRLREHYRVAHNEMVSRAMQLRQTIILKEMRGVCRGEEDVTQLEDYELEEEVEVEESEDDLELSEEMLEFFRVTRQHRIDRDKKRAEERLGDGKEGSVDKAGAIDIQYNIDNESWLVHGATTSAPAEQPDSRRKEELTQLYGSHSREVDALETQLQLIFERDTDLYQPRPWPNMPLNFT